MAARGDSVIKSTAAANVSAITSAGFAGVTWVTQMNAYLQLGATVVAIIAGCMAIWWHVEKIITARRERARAQVDKG